MKKITLLMLTLLLFLSVPVPAKDRLPVKMSCTASFLSIRFLGDVKDVRLTIKGTGSVTGASSRHSVGTAVSGQEVQIPLNYSLGAGPGGIAVHLQGDLGYGTVGQARTFDLVSRSLDVRSRDWFEETPPMIVLPSQTIVNKRNQK